MKILIDNGHGSNTPGKASPDGRLREYAYTREVAKGIVTGLKRKGYDAELLTPETLDVKLGEQEDGTPVYHTFTSLNAFGDFDDKWQQHIMQCLTDGWAVKDGIDWSVYGTQEQ